MFLIWSISVFTTETRELNLPSLDTSERIIIKQLLLLSQDRILVKIWKTFQGIGRYDYITVDTFWRQQSYWHPMTIQASQPNKNNTELCQELINTVRTLVLNPLVKTSGIWQLGVISQGTIPWCAEGDDTMVFFAERFFLLFE